MALRLRSLSLFVLALVPMSGCEGCDTEEPNGTPVDTISFRFPNGNTLQSDGITRLALVVKATNASGEPELAAMTITREEGAGQLAIGGGAPNPDSVTGDPNEDGEFEFEVICSAAGRLSLEADNGKVKKTGAVTCNPLTGDITIDIDADCDDLQADGRARCPVTLHVERQSTPVLPLQGPVSITVAGVTPTTAGGATDDAVLDADTIEGGLATSLNVVTDANGDATFYVGSPAFNLEQTATIDVTVAGGPTRSFDVTIDAFDSRAAVAFVQPPQSVIGGDSVTFVLHATTTDGVNAADVDIKVTRTGDFGTLAGEASGIVTVTTDANGDASVTLDTDVVNATAEVRLNAEYEAIPGFVTVEASTTVEVVEADALVLNVGADPTEIRSDNPVFSTTRITASFTQNGGPVAGGVLTASIDPGDNARAVFADDPAAGTVTVTLDAAGTGTVDVVAVPDALGPVTIVFIGDDGVGGELPVSREVTIEVVRDPQLRSIVFGAAAPAIIGAIGGQLESTSTVTFRLVDDRGDPMPGETVEFSMPAVSDPLIVLTPATALSDAGGVVTCAVSAGTRAGPIVVQAFHPDTGVVAQSAPIAVVGGAPAMQTSYLRCDPDSVSDPFTINCGAVIADRFTNVVGGQAVQFRAEGSVGTASAVTGPDGSASVSFVSGGFTVSGADVSFWSYGLALPESPADLGTFSGAAACFDGNSATACDLVDLCDDTDGDAANAALCPLLPTCTANISATAQDFLDQNPSPLELALDPALQAAREVYLSEFDACGFPLSCFTGNLAGARTVLGDECPVAPGCFDFVGSTRCPQDALLTVVATTRGEEIFTDTNGDNVFNVGVELFVDSPEPFHDKNDNCARDDMAGVTRYDGTLLQAANTDSFTDTDNNGAFGFGPLQTETNGVWDPNTEIMLMTHVLLVENPTLLDGGEVCGAPGETVVCAADGSPRPCVETSPGVGIIDDCYSSIIEPDEEQQIFFHWADNSGNCPEFGSTAKASLTGPARLVGAPEITFAPENCGMADAPSVREPHCTASPALRAPTGNVTIVPDCEGQDGPGQVELTLQQGANVEVVLFTVNCPAA